MLKAARLLGERVAGLKVGSFALEKVLPVAAGIGGGSADAAAALRLLARLNDLALDDERLREVALATGADVPVCLASRACDMTGVGETLLRLSPPKMPCVLVNPCVPVATKDVFEALGLRHGELLVGATDVMMQGSSWPEEGGSLEEWVEALAPGRQRPRGTGDENPARHRRGHLGAQCDQWRLACADVGLGRDLFCDLREHCRCKARGAGRSCASTPNGGCMRGC